MSKIFGLDFGTSNSALSLNSDSQVTRVDIDPFNKNGTTRKSLIYYDESEKKLFSGQQAVDLYIENDANGRYVQSIKSFLTDKTFDRTEIGGKSYEIEQLIAVILKEIKKIGENKSGEAINDVVLGRPVVFSEDKDLDTFAEKRLISAAKIAGFKNVYLQLEPIAAALSYESKLPEGKEKLVFVGDFGGGTSDFTIIKTTGGKQKIKSDRKDDILSTGGVYIGGDFFDSQIMWERVSTYFGRYLKLHDMDSRISGGEAQNNFPIAILKNLCKWHYIPRLGAPKTLQSIRELKYLADNVQPIENIINLIEENYGYNLFAAIEKVKCELSSHKESEFFFKENTLIIEESITRPEFEKMIHAEVLTIKSCVETVLKKAGLKASDIDIVFLTGGSSFIPCIKHYFGKEFSRGEIVQADPFTSVAYGLGLYSNLYI